MRITQEGDYALRVVLYLYGKGMGQRVEAKTISESEKVPQRFLLKLMRKMAAAGIVKSYRGTGGGFAIEKPPHEITVRAVLESVEGPICINKCLSDPKMCNLNRTATCHIHKALENFQKGLIDDLDKLNFEILLGSENNYQDKKK